MKQQTLAMAADQCSGFEHYRKPTRREEFLKTMEAIVPWSALCEVIEPHYPKAGNGRPPIGLERIHFIQHWPSSGQLSVGGNNYSLFVLSEQYDAADGNGNICTSHPFGGRPKHGQNVWRIPKS